MEYKGLDKLKIANPSLSELGDEYVAMDKLKGTSPDEKIISQKVTIPRAKIERAIQFWKPRYFDYTVEDKEGSRLLNGIEAYELGDPKLHDPPNPVPYIAMCNLMALEALIRIGEQGPTTEKADRLGYGSEREKDISDFWKNTFAPTSFQANWAWTAVMAVLAGEPYSTADMIDRFQEQLP